MSTLLIEQVERMGLDTVRMTPTNKIFRPRTIDRLRPLMKPKMCYSNAWHACFERGVGYAEGWVEFDNLAFYHAFNFRNGKFFDPTTDLVLDTTNGRYFLTGTCSAKHLEDMLLKTQEWGPIFFDLNTLGKWI